MAKLWVGKSGLSSKAEREAMGSHLKVLKQTINTFSNPSPLARRLYSCCRRGDEERAAPTDVTRILD